MASLSERVTLKTVAEAAGVSVASVSMALRNQAGISLPTRKRIQEVATRLGYIPDPALSALVAYRQDVRRSPVETTVAVVEVHSGTFVVPSKETCEITAGLVDAGKELGYKLDWFSVGVEVSEQKALFRVLHYRGVRGIVFFFADVDAGAVKADWSQFCSVGIGNGLLHGDSPMAIARSDNFHSAAECVYELVHRGYKRPLLLIPIRFPARLKREITGGFLGGLHEGGISREKAILEVAYLEDTWKTIVSEEISTHNPDVLICAGRSEGLQELLNAMQESPLRPDFCSLDVFPSDHEISGFIQPREGVGRLALDTLHKHLMANIMGPASQPRSIHIHGVWNDGKTIRSAPLPGSPPPP